MKYKLSLFGNHTFLLFVCLLFSGLQTSYAQVQWRPVTPAELEMKTPQVEADADAEALFWEVRLDDKKSGKMFYNHYVRVKIFTERGRERFSKFDIPFGKGKKVEEVAARVIKPDGTTVELQPGDIFEREIFKAGKFSVKAKSFAVPGIEPGVIVEYQYKETFKGDSADNERLIFQRDIPMQKVTYYVRPYQGARLNFTPKNMPSIRFVPLEDGFYRATLENVPAFKQEPQMPPEDEVRQWVLLSYASFGSSFVWSYLGTRFGLEFNEIIKPTKEISEKAEELTAGATTDGEKLKRLYDFAQRQIRNVTFDSSLTDEQRESFKNKKVSDTLKRGMGTSMDVDMLFAALAKDLGFEVDIMFSSDRSESFFSPDRNMGLSYIHRSGVAVGRGNVWMPYNPGTPFMPFGMVDWYEEGGYTMIAGVRGSSWVRIPVTDYAKSSSRRTGKFKLTEDGTLEGMMRVEYDGQEAITRRREWFEKTPSEREEFIKKGWKALITAADISLFSLENFNDSSKPLVYSFKVSVPNYAQKTGKRIFLQPGFFEYGTSPLFSSASRKYDIYFNYPWSENDSLEIELPNNFEPENWDSPGTVMEKNNIGALNINISVSKETNVLKYERVFHFGGNETITKIMFPSTAYQSLKFLFDSFHKANLHTVTLKQKQ